MTQHKSKVTSSSSTSDEEKPAQNLLSSASKLKHQRRTSKIGQSASSVTSRFGNVTEHLVDGPDEFDDAHENDVK